MSSIRSLFFNALRCFWSVTAVLWWSPARAQNTAPWCAPPNPTGCHKFVVYSSSPAHALDVEIIGTVAGWHPNIPDYVFIEPDPNYSHLLLDGNHHIPEDQETRSWWVPNVNRQDVFKLEAHDGAGHRPATTDDSPLRVWDALYRRWIDIQRYQRVKFRGLLVADVSHDPYHPLHTDPWCRMRGLYRACDVHMEIHPYLWDGMTLYYPPSDACLGVACANSETLTAIAPLFQQVYSWTYFMNRLAGIAGDFVDDYRQTSMLTPPLYIAAPPRPAACAAPGSCRIAWDSTVVEAGNGSSGSTTPIINSNGISVQLSAQSNDGYWPKVRKETFRVWWKLEPAQIMNVVNTILQ